MKKKLLWTSLILLVAIWISYLFYPRYYWRFYVKYVAKNTIASRIKQYGPGVKKRLLPEIKSKNLPYPIPYVKLLVFKQEKKMELWGAEQTKQWKFIKQYPVLGASGTMGPKLREGDRQVPEGIYQIDALNPNSYRHLSLKINYPNAFDQNIAKKENRSNLGGNIFVHGGHTSEGCLAIGDRAIEEIFILVAETMQQGQKIEIIISPLDFRSKNCPEPKLQWQDELYRQLAEKLKKFTR